MKRERYLTSDSKKSEYNTWDNVFLEDDKKAEAELKIKEDIENIDTNGIIYEKSSISWDKFYKNHKTSFFKNRKWIKVEFPDLFDSNQKILEIGCGVGNSLHELCKTENDIYACDFSKNAISLANKNIPNVNFFVHDISCKDLIPFKNFDCIVSIYALSAIDPLLLPNVFKKINESIKIGGKLFFVDYGFMDMVQLRYNKNQIVSKNFYKRKDGTFQHFFEIDYLKNIIEDSGFSVESLFEKKTLKINRKRGLEMYRVMIQGIFVKV